MWETRVQSLGGKDPLREETATHSNILAWKIPWTEKPGGLQSRGSERVRPKGAPIHVHTHRTNLSADPGIQERALDR